MKVKVRLEDLDRTIDCDVGDDLRTAMLESDVTPYGQGFFRNEVFNCHGRALCGQCKINVVEGAEGLNEPSPHEKLVMGLMDGIQSREKKPGDRLACLARCYRDVVVETIHDPPPAKY